MTTVFVQMDRASTSGDNCCWDRVETYLSYILVVPTENLPLRSGDQCVYLFSNPSEPYTPYDVEIIPVTWVVGQGEITRQTVFTQEGGKFTSNLSKRSIHLTIMLALYKQFRMLADHCFLF